MGSMVQAALENVTMYLSLYIPSVRGFKGKFKFGVGIGGVGWEGSV